jgi:hypothetical protein
MSLELWNFHFNWHMVLLHPSDAPGVPKHLGDPRECIIQHDSLKEGGLTEYQNRYKGRGRRTRILESRFTPYLSF